MFSLSLYDINTCGASYPRISTVSKSGSTTCPLLSLPPYLMFFFVPIIFGITFAITAIKMHFQAKIMGKGIVEALRTKTACLHFMVMPRLTLFKKLITVESRHIVASHKMVINTLVIQDLFQPKTSSSLSFSSM